MGVRVVARVARLDTGTTPVLARVTPLAYLCMVQVRWTQPALNRLDAAPTAVAASVSRDLSRLLIV